MKNKILIICSFFPCYLFSQVGIGTDNPQSILEIFNTTDSKEDKSVNISNLENEKIFTINNNGNVKFKGPLKIYNESTPLGDPGKNYQYLISNGLNNPPKWETFDFLIDNPSTILNLFQISRTYSETPDPLPNNTLTQVTYPPNVSNINIDSDPNIGYWDENENKFIIKKKGIYIISSVVQTYSSTSIVRLYFKPNVYIEDIPEYVLCNNASTSCVPPYYTPGYGEHHKSIRRVVAYLDVNDEIYQDVISNDLINSNNPEKRNFLFFATISISYINSI